MALSTNAHGCRACPAGKFVHRHRHFAWRHGTAAASAAFAARATADAALVEGELDGGAGGGLTFRRWKFAGSASVKCGVERGSVELNVGENGTIWRLLATQ